MGTYSDGRFLLSGLLVVVLVSGCAGSGPRPISAEQRAALGRVGVATVHYAPDIAYHVTDSRGEGAAKGAAAGAAVSIYGGLSTGDPFGPLIGLLLAPVFAAGGGIYGAVASDSAAVVRAQIDPVDSYFFVSELQQKLTLEVLAHTAWRTTQSLARIGLKGSESAGQPKDFHDQTDLDTVLEVGLQQIALNDLGLSNQQIYLKVVASARLVQVRDGRLLAERKYDYLSVARSLAEWAKNDARHLNDDLLRAFEHIGGRMVDDLFLPVISLPKASSALVATRPLPEFCFFCSQGTKALRTRQPRLCWQAFPDVMTPDDDNGDRTVAQEGVVYDLWVKERAGRTAVIAYEIEPTCHQLSEPLKACTLYDWQVRARYLVAGEVQATPWVTTLKHAFKTKCE